MHGINGTVMSLSESQMSKKVLVKPAFLKNFSSPEIYFHPQLTADGALILELAELFHSAWHEFVPPPA